MSMYESLTVYNLPTDLRLGPKAVVGLPVSGPNIEGENVYLLTGMCIDETHDEYRPFDLVRVDDGGTVGPRLARFFPVVTTVRGLDAKETGSVRAHLRVALSGYGHHPGDVAAEVLKEESPVISSRAVVYRRVSDHHCKVFHVPEVNVEAPVRLSKRHAWIESSVADTVLGSEAATTPDGAAVNSKE